MHHHEPYEHMGVEQRARRQRLRAHGRQLGDRRDARSGSRTIDRLVHECAYEHWHGMLFARFLAENRLLIEPEMEIAVTLEECEDLGKEAGIDKWAMAAHFAHRMLPQVFRPAHPAFEVQLAREHRLRLEGLAESLPVGVFAATDALGWVYQFWQSRKKNEVNRSEVKIGADELPAVTQLFTEPYMVRFLLDNSLGAWWATRRLSNSDPNGAATEAELRRKAAIPGVPLDYLRFVQSEGIAESGGARSSAAIQRSSDESTGPRAGTPEEQHFEEVPSSPDEEARSSPAPRMAASKTADPCGSVKGSSSAFPSQDTSSPAPGAQTSNAVLGARASSPRAVHAAETTSPWHDRGYLPHFEGGEVVQSITFRLHDSLPSTLRAEWAAELERLPENERTIHHRKRIEAALDRGHGACFLANPHIARLVADALQRFDGERYRLHAWCVMPNHVHVVVTPLAGHTLSSILHSWKSFTASKANTHLGRRGGFWMQEYFDRAIRDERHFRAAVEYVEHNPVGAGLCEAPQHWPWSSLGAQASCPRGQLRAGSPCSQGGGVLPGAGARVDRSGSPSGSSLAGSGEVHRGDHQREGTPGPWRLAVGAFSAWPEHLGELKVLDPCCGSGHFLVAAFSMLVPMRMEREGLSARDAVNAVLRENLHGLELDPRCVELAAFALALAAWTYPGGEGYRPLPELNLACSGLSVGAAKERWTELAAGHHNLRIALDWMYDEFREAPVLGSLLNPAATKAANLMDWSSLSAALAKALAQEESDERRETAVAAQGLAKAAELLAGRYHWVITNVPYLTRGKQGEKLRALCKQHYPAARNDLATVFLERCLGLCAEGGAASLVLPQNWLFLSGYRKLREKLLKTETWHLLARLGPGAFETISGEVVKAILLTLSRSHPAGGSADLFGEETSPSTMYGLDVSESRTAGEKAARLQGAAIMSVEQARQLKNPDARVVLGSSLYGVLLEKFAFAPNGMHGGDSRRFRFLFWEVSFDNVAWHHFQAAVDETVHYGGREHVFFWPDDGRIHHESPIAYVKGKAVWGKPGIVVRVMRELPVTLYSGNIFDISCVPIAPRSSEYLLPIWCFCSSPEYHDAVRRIDQKLNVTNATLAKVPFDLDRWTKVANEQYPNGLPRPYSDDPTQWIFHGHPCGSVVWDEAEKRTAHGPLRTDPTVLQVAVARLLGYRWPAEQDAGMDLADEQREWVRRCEAFLAWADEDGIVCIPPVRGEPPAGERLLGLLAAAFGDAWNDGALTRLLAEASRPSLEDWLRNGFFDEHCKWFHHRPFVWHIWDGRRRDGFHALVSYHKLAEGDGKGRRLLESLTYSYLGDWITRQQDGVKRGEGGADDRLAAALELKRRLAAILEGEPPFDIFVRWKPISEQPVGWEPDLNDGVRLNIRPFMADDLPGGKKGAGILRAKPKLHWRKDRGREPFRDQAPFPWFWRGGEFTGERVNDVHLSIAEKSVPPLAAGPGRQ